VKKINREKEGGCGLVQEHIWRGGYQGGETPKKTYLKGAGVVETNPKHKN